MRTSYLKRVLFAALAALIVFTGCDKPFPTDQLARAKLMLAKAEAVEAPAYAPDIYKQASDLLMQAINSSGDKEKLAEAGKKADESYVKAEEAYLIALKERCKALITRLDAADADLKEKKADSELAEKYAEFAKAFTDGKVFFEAAKYIDSYDKLREAEVLKDRLLSELDNLYARMLNAIDKADAAIADAVKNGADEFAADLMKQARTLLEEAVSLKDEKSYQAAIVKAEEAEKAALDALDKARAAASAQKQKAAQDRIDAAAAKLAEAKLYFASLPCKEKADMAIKGAEDNLKRARAQLGEGNYELASNLADESMRLAQMVLETNCGGTVPAGSKSYTVRLIPERRDCLWRIAGYDFIFNNPFKWPVIWKANLTQVEDPDLIFPGQVFEIPEE